MAKYIAIVEDEQLLRENYMDILQQQGYQLKGFADRNSAILAFSQQLPDLAILDVGLEDEIEGGFELCRQLRNLSQTLPIIFLTAHNNDFDTISGLRLGADDYLGKDISPPQLCARIAALFRRTQALQHGTEKPQIIHINDLKLDLDRFEAWWQQQAVYLTLTEFWMLHALVKHPGHVKNREQLMQEANTLVDDSTITSHIKRMRKKFTHIDPEFSCIDTVYGIGYRWYCHPS